MGFPRRSCYSGISDADLYGIMKLLNLGKTGDTKGKKLLGNEV